MSATDDVRPILEAAGLIKDFRGGPFSPVIHAVNCVSFAVQPGETVGMVGESGSGKTTIGRMLMRLLRPTSGAIAFGGRDISTLSERAARAMRADLQIVFQDPWSSLNPRLSIRSLIEEPLLIHTTLSKAERRDRADALARRVHLSTDLLDHYSGQLSGGQLQRVCIARALATDPKLLVLDEPTSALDLSVRASILDLLKELQNESGMAMVFISHDLATVRFISDRVIVLYAGSIVEEGATGDVFDHPQHPYTKALMSAHLPADPTAVVHPERLSGDSPSPIALPPGCAFATRCPRVIPQCSASSPSLLPVMDDGGRATSQKAACIRLPHRAMTETR
jgi:oligopeptide/dipeptide ABC transporter ATP-binding protein